MATLRSGARVNPSEVAEMFDTSLDADALTHHINTASLRVDDIAAADSTVSSERLTQIELYWAAEVACTQDPRALSEGIKNSNVDYNVTSTYGEMAVDLDPTGTLREEGVKTAQFDVPNVKGTDHDYTQDNTKELN